MVASSLPLNGDAWVTSPFPISFPTMPLPSPFP